MRYGAVRPLDTRHPRVRAGNLGIAPQVSMAFSITSRSLQREQMRQDHQTPGREIHLGGFSPLVAVPVGHGVALFPSPHQLELQELATRRRQLTAMVVQEKNRLAQARLKNLRRSIRKSLAFLVRMIRDVDKQISQHIQDDPQRKIMVEQLETVPGISSVSAQQLLIALPEIGTLTRRKIASLAGLAPFARDSGGSTGQRSIRGGRRYARHALFMPTMCAIRHNPIIKEMYQRLLAAGKRRMVALVACMRKLLILLNSMVKQSKNWEQFLKNTTTESTPVSA